MSPLKKGSLVAVLALALALNSPVAFAQSLSDPISLLTSTFSNPASLITFVIELVLGLGLGYFSTKIFKYVLALVGIFIVGVLLNIWQSPNLGSNLQSQLSQYGLTWDKIQPVVTSVIYMFGLTTIFPITLGFVIGIIIAVAK